MTTFYGRCLVCGDEWVERTPPAICPECHSLDVQTTGQAPEPFVDDDGVELVTEDGKLTLEGAARLLGEEV